MATRLSDRTYWKKYCLVFFVSAAPFIVGMVLFWRDPDPVLCAVLGGYALAAWLWWRWWTKRYKCPRCGTLITHPTITDPEERDPVNFYCERCDIEWETGFHTTYED